MRILILTSPHHLYGNYLVKQLLKRDDLFDIVGVVERMRDENAIPVEQPRGETGSYYPVPTKEAVRRYRKSGRKFFTMSQLRRPFESL